MLFNFRSNSVVNQAVLLRFQPRCVVHLSMELCQPTCTVRLLGNLCCAVICQIVLSVFNQVGLLSCQPIYVVNCQPSCVLLFLPRQFDFTLNHETAQHTLLTSAIYNLQ